MSCFKKEIVRITDNVYLNPDDFSSIEYEKGGDQYWGPTIHAGSIVTMKSGRKIFIQTLTPEQVVEKMKETKNDPTT